MNDLNLDSIEVQTAFLCVNGKKLFWNLSSIVYRLNYC